MAMSVGNGNKATSHRRRGRKHALMSEINVTPFVDVMLVLLIVFMVSAPLLVNGVPLQLPKTQAGALNSDTQPLTVSVTNDGRYAILNEYYTLEQMPAVLEAMAENAPAGKGQRIWVRAADDTSYGNVLKIVAVLQKAGFENLAMASAPQQTGQN